MTKHSVFYFDDEPALLDLFEQMFESEYDVRTATALTEARRTLAERAADIVISDQQMPEIAGTDFLSETAKLYPASYRVMLTGSIHIGDALSEIASGTVQLFIPKPWTKQTMRQMLELAGQQFEVNRNKA